MSGAPCLLALPVPRCRVCGTDVTTAVRREPGGHVLNECETCGVWSVWPSPSLDRLRACYDVSYYAAWDGESRARRRMWRRRLRFLRDAPGRTLLDVGCAEGDFLEVARAAGFDVRGTELSPHAAARTGARLGVPVHCGELAEARFDSGTFAVVTLWHVLEHLLEPGRTLREAHRVLEPGGLLVVGVPNRICPIFRAAYRAVRGRTLHLYHPDDREQHLHHWEARSLAHALGHAGFEVQRIVPDRCAIGAGKVAVDLVSRLHSVVARAPRTAAMVAVARRGGAS